MRAEASSGQDPGVKRTRLVLLAALALVAILIVVLAGRNRQPPLLPSDESHRAWQSAAACLSCHGPREGLPRGANHPLGDDCLRCHGTR